MGATLGLDLRLWLGSGSRSRDLLAYGLTHRLQSSSFLGLPYRILNMKPKKELLWEPLGRDGLGDSVLKRVEGGLYGWFRS